MKRIILTVCLLLSIAVARKTKEVDVPIDISAGPAFHMLPDELSNGEGMLMGLAIDAYAVITPEVMKANMDRIPKKWRKFISKDQEMQIKPFYLSLMPTTFLIHTGTDHEAYAATWSLLGLNWVAQPLPYLEASFGIKLPTITYAWIQSPRIEEGDKSFLGLGASPGCQILWRPLPYLHFSARWDEHFYLPIAATEYTPIDRQPENWSMHGVASLQMHVRIPSKQKI